MVYIQAKLKRNGYKASPCFKPFFIGETCQTNFCIPGICYMFHSDTFLFALPVSWGSVMNGRLSPQRGASSGCRWRNGLHYYYNYYHHHHLLYAGYLYIYKGRSLENQNFFFYRTFIANTEIIKLSLFNIVPC